MTEYETRWIDSQLPSGQDFSMAVCSYSGKIRHMIIGKDFLRRTMIKSVDIDDCHCTSGAHCLDTTCKFNTTQREHMAHMLDMWTDEKLDEETAKIWGTDSAVDALVHFAEKMNESIPADLNSGSGGNNGAD